jgi:NTE family protein
MSKAVQASIALPGLFPPLKYDDRWLVDGGLVNPVPVSVCRALGAEFVIAVNLNGNIVGKHLVRNAKDKKDNEEQKQREQQATNDAGLTDKVVQRIKEYSSSLLGDFMEEDSAPGLFDAIAGSINITQDRITRSRMAGDPPDLLLAPKLSHIELLEFHRASDAIAEGEACVERLSSEIKYALQID